MIAYYTSYGFHHVQFCKSPLLSHPKGALLDSDAVTGKGQYHKKNINLLSCSLNQFEVDFAATMVHYNAGSTHEKTENCGHEWRVTVNNKTQIGCDV